MEIWRVRIIKNKYETVYRCHATEEDARRDHEAHPGSQPPERAVYLARYRINLLKLIFNRGGIAEEKIKNVYYRMGDGAPLVETRMIKDEPKQMTLFEPA